MPVIATTTMMPIGMSKRTRARSQRERFVSPAVCICAEGNTLPPLDISAPGQDSEQKLANDLQFARKSRPPGTAPLSAATG
jgi:hypothetical protein